jgi:opacity protein-like surface antigen
MRRFAIGLAVFAMLALAPRPAHAQSYFVPFYGFEFGGDAGDCPSVLNNCSVKRSAYGFGVGHLSHGILGFEEDFSYAPDFFGTSPSFGPNNSVLTLMSNLVVSIPAGPVHPYVSGGIGLMRTKVDLTLNSLLSTNNTSLGYNLGGGVMIFLPGHLGLRVDYRNLRSATNVTVAGITLQGPKLNFSRIAFGLVLH